MLIVAPGRRSAVCRGELGAGARRRSGRGDCDPRALRARHHARAHPGTAEGWSPPAHPPRLVRAPGARAARRRRRPRGRSAGCVSALQGSGCWVPPDVGIHVAVRHRRARLRRPADARARLSSLDATRVHWCDVEPDGRLSLGVENALRQVVRRQPIEYVVAIADSPFARRRGRPPLLSSRRSTERIVVAMRCSALAVTACSGSPTSRCSSTGLRSRLPCSPPSPAATMADGTSAPRGRATAPRGAPRSALCADSHAAGIRTMHPLGVLPRPTSMPNTVHRVWAQHPGPALAASPVPRTAFGNKTW